MKRLSKFIFFALALSLSWTMTNAQTYTYSSIPSPGSFTSTGSGTSTHPAIKYSTGNLAGGNREYTNGQIKTTVYEPNSKSYSGTITFYVYKESGYFKNGNSGKLFIFDMSEGEVYSTSFSISNSTTRYLPAYVRNYGDFEGTRKFKVFLVTSDEVYWQYGGEINITGSKSQLPPTVSTEDVENITSNSATLTGIVNPNGSKTTYYFSYKSSSQSLQTTSKTISASSGETSVTANVSNLSSNTTYTVVLYAENDGGKSSGGATTFKTLAAPNNNPPSKPQISSPDDGASNVATSGRLYWSCSDPDGDALTYTVYLGTTATNWYPYKTNKNYLDYSDLDNNTRYYWKVVASDGEDETPGNTWSFKTVSVFSNPSSPSPANGATNVAVSGNLSWSCDAAAVSHNVFLATDPNFTNRVGGTDAYDSGSGNSCHYELEAGTTYYWKVCVWDASNNPHWIDGDKSKYWTFTTAGSVNDDITVDQAVQYLQGKGVLDSGDANVNGELLRQQLAKVAFRGVYSIKGRSVPSTVPSDNYPTIYTDLTNRSAYYYQAARALLYLEYGDGITPFDRNRFEFDPDKSIARVDVLKVLMETFNIQPDASITNPFPNDANVSGMKSAGNFKYGYIAKAADLGIVKKPSNGQNTEFRPFAYCTRGEVFIMLARIMKKVDAGAIKDPNPNNGDYFEPLNTTLQTIALGLGLPLGNFSHYTKTSFAIAGTVPLTFAHTYNSYNTTLPEVFYGINDNGETYQPLGEGWSHNFHSFITVPTGLTGSNTRVAVHWGGGSIDIYKSNGSKFVPESYGVYDEFSIEGKEIIIKTKSQMEYHFSAQGGSGSGGMICYLSSIKDRNGNTLTINYESGAKDMKRISSVSDGNRQLTFSYRTGTDLLTKVSDPLGRSISFNYETNRATGGYRLCRFTDANGNTTKYIYEDNSKVSTSKLLTKIQLPKGNYIENEYDANRRLKNTVSGINGIPTTQTAVTVNTNYSGSASTSSHMEVTRNGSQTSSYNYTYNANNVVTRMTGEEGLYVNSTYGNSTHPQLPTAIKSNSTDVSNVTYDSKGNITRITVTGDGTLTTSMTYDSMNNLTSITDPNNNQTTYSYDARGNLVGVSAPEGVSSSIVVNSKGLPTEITNAMGVKTQFEYNSYGNLTKTTLPALSLSTSATYDKVSRLKSSTDALNRTTKFEYDDNDNLIRTTDPENRSTDFDYDANDNMKSITNAKGGVTSMSYDNATDWLTSVSFAGSTKEFDYNDDGSLKTFTKPDGTTLRYTYDDLGRVTNDGINSYSYDSKMRLSSVSGNGKTLSFTYDGFNRITRTDCDGHSNSYTYDNNGNRLSINNTTYSYDGLNRLTSVKFNGKTITYTYRKDNQLSIVSYPNGMTTTYEYDAVGRMTNKTTKLSNGTVVAGYSYTLDKVGNITKQTNQEPYSNISLANEDISYSYNSGNRITKAGDISFSFDDNGNTTKRGSESYSWDKSDRLVRAGSTSIEYDPLGLIASYGDTEFTTDPLGIGNVLSDSKSGAQFIYGNGLEARVKNGNISYYVTDVRGSVIAIVDENGNITHKYQYDDYGNVTQKQEADYNPFQYVGKYGVMYLTDHQYYMRARHYDPTIGRFLSEDPIWSTNLYPYADNNPIMGIDPQGLKAVEIMKDLAKKAATKGTKTVSSVAGSSKATDNLLLSMEPQVRAKDVADADALIKGWDSTPTVKTTPTTNGFVGGTPQASDGPTKINWMAHIPRETIKTTYNEIKNWGEGQTFKHIGEIAESIAKDGTNSVIELTYHGPFKGELKKLAKEYGIPKAIEGYGMLIDCTNFENWAEKQFEAYYINKYNDVY